MEIRTLVGWMLVLLAGSLLWTGTAQEGFDLLSTESEDAPRVDRSFELNVTAVPCDVQEDGICLAYDGQIPGPTLIVHEDDWVEITVHNRIAESLEDQNMTAPDLAEANVSLHTHGVHVGADKDGIPSREGTHLIDSTVGPNQTFTYRFHAVYEGTWHFHDHALGPEGHEGQHRGLYGLLYVADRGQDLGTLEVLDLHLLDNGPNSGQGLEATVPADHSLVLGVVGLGNWWFETTLTDPDGQVVGTAEAGPGTSLGIRELTLTPGNYTWTTELGPRVPTLLFPDAPYNGTIQVVGS